MPWQSLGFVTPNFDLWLPFPGDVGNSSVFRVQFISSGNVENIFSILWLRRVWKFGAFKDKEVEIARRIYPQPHSIILDLPIPDPLRYGGIIPAGYECKLERRYRKGNYTEPNFYVNLDAFETETLGSLDPQLQVINSNINEVLLTITQFSQLATIELGQINQDLDILSQDLDILLGNN